MSSQQAPQGGGGQGGGQNYISQEDQTDEKEIAFESAFKDMCYGILSTKQPHLVPSIVTFKVIKSSIRDGDAVGAFILNVKGEQLYVPMVLSNNKLKPLEIFYSKKMDKFLPFSPQWLDIVVGSSNQHLGEGVEIPDTLPNDRDITQFIIPPMNQQGRVSYAMDFSGIDHLEIIKQASNEAKDQYRKMLQGNKGYLKFAFENFDGDEIKTALAPHTEVEKVASVPVALETVDLDSPVMKVKEVFKNDSQKAMQDMARDGFSYKDERIDLNKVMSTSETKLTLEEPGTSGVYTIYNCDGSFAPALVLVNPETLDDHDASGLMTSSVAARDNNEDTYGESVYGDWRERPIRRKNQYLVISEDGSYFHTDHLIASPSNAGEFKGKLSGTVFGSKKPDGVSKANICFIKVEGNQIVAATKPVYVDKMETSKDGYKKYTQEDPFKPTKPMIYGEKRQEPSNTLELCHCSTPTGKITHPKGSRLTFVPLTYKVIKLGDRKDDNSHLRTSREVLHYIQERMNNVGGKTVKLANIGAGEYALDGHPVGDLRKTAEVFATRHYISMDTAVACLRKLSSTGQFDNVLVMPNEKTASIFSTGADGTTMTPEAVQQDAMQMGGPQMGGPPMDPRMQAPMAQPQPGQSTLGQGGQMPVERPNTSMMDIGQKTKDKDLYNVGVLNSLTRHQDVRDLLAIYSPTLEKTLDNVGRMLLTFWIRSGKAREDLGEESYYATEESLRTVFKELGSLLLRLNQRSQESEDTWKA